MVSMAVALEIEASGFKCIKRSDILVLLSNSDKICYVWIFLFFLLLEDIRYDKVDDDDILKPQT